MKRILYLSRGGQIGGSQRQLYYLLSNLTDDFSPVVFFNRGGGANKLVSEGFFVHLIIFRLGENFQKVFFAIVMRNLWFGKPVNRA